MTPAPTDLAPAAPAEAEASTVADRAQAQLAAWRREGAWRADPARFAFLEALARRLGTQRPPVQARLAERLSQGLADYTERLAQARRQLAEAVPDLAAAQPALARALRLAQTQGDARQLRRLARRADAATPSPLAGLLAHLAQASPTLRAALPQDAGREELASVRAFRRAWGRGRSQQQVALAALRRPVQAGPLNSHALVLQALERMQQLSPDYLRHFVIHLEALQWLAAAREAPPPEPTRPARPARRPRA